MMLSQKQINEIREALQNSQNPLFFFDNDADGLCSFLLLSRMIGRGKGVAIKSFPELNESYARKIDELNPDCVFILDKPIISDEFKSEVKKHNLPFFWIDHHDVDTGNIDGINYYNPLNDKKKSSEPITYWSYKISGRKEDLWLAVAGCIADNFFPEFVDEFAEEYPELWNNANTAFQALYETQIGKLTRIFSFSLKDRTSNVVRMLKLLLRVKSPFEILDESNKNSLVFRFEQVNKKYQKLFEKATVNVSKGKLLYFQYGGDLSLSADISNELSYRFPDKVIVVAYIKGTKVNISLRGKNVRDITMKVIEGFEGATGGGHENATGCKIQVEDLPKFKERIEELANKEY